MVGSLVADVIAKFLQRIILMMDSHTYLISKLNADTKLSIQTTSSELGLGVDDGRCRG